MKEITSNDNDKNDTNDSKSIGIEKEDDNDLKYEMVEKMTRTITDNISYQSNQSVLKEHIEEPNSSICD